LIKDGQKKSVLFIFLSLLNHSAEGQSPQPGPIQKDSDQKVISTQKNIHLELSGHINRTMLYAKSHHKEALLHVDNGNSPSRVRFLGNGQINDHASIGSAVEFDFLQDSSNFNDITTQPTNNTLFRSRRVEAILASSKYGTVWLGHGWMASDYVSENDLTGTDVVAFGAAVDNVAGATKFRDKRGSGPTVGDVFSALQLEGGIHRLSRIRYDTPKYNGFSLGASHAIKNIFDVALKNSSKINGTDVEAGISFGERPKQYKHVMGSIAALFPCGLSFVASGGVRKNTFSSTSPLMRHFQSSFYFGKIGYKFRVFDVGHTATAIDFGHYNNIAQKKDRSHSGAFSIVQNFTDYGTELYFTYRQYQLKRIARHFKPIQASMLGVRIKF
jgi:predicted porin